jgi:hypothetical protein
MKFAAERRPSLKTEQPELTFGEVPPRRATPRPHPTALGAPLTRSLLLRAQIGRAPSAEDRAMSDAQKEKYF